MKIIIAVLILILIGTLAVDIYVNWIKRKDIDFEARKKAAMLLNHLYPNYGSCGRCNLKWPLCETHITRYSKTGGCFPLCEDCWSELEPAQRLHFYRALINSWKEMAKSQEEIDNINRKWPLIEEAVLAGK